ncbi:MAG TPA: hypothetical protein DIS96_03815 [Pusillimonas sp.]|nr:hypothetical protein [Pusillimonas sp.]
MSENKKPSGWIGVAKGLDFPNIKTALEISNAQEYLSCDQFNEQAKATPHRIDGYPVVRVFHKQLQSHMFFAQLAKGRVRTFLVNDDPYVFASPQEIKRYFAKNPVAAAVFAVPVFFLEGQP